MRLYLSALRASALLAPHSEWRECDAFYLTDRHAKRTFVLMNMLLRRS